MALAAIRARLRQAIVHVRLAQRASEARHAEAAERIDQVGARASVQARIIRLAVIDVRLAQWARKTRWAYTFETVHLVDTRAAILAPIHSAVIHLVAAVGAIKTIGAEAHVALVGRVHAGGTMKAWIVGACLLCRSFAAASVKSRRAVARSICFARTGSTVEARNDSAIIFDQLAIGSGVLGRAGTGVGALTRVETGAAVLAGLVIGAVVEILIAKQTAPTFVAIALPRLLARSVQAARVANALVAQFALPSQFA